LLLTAAHYRIHSAAVMSDAARSFLASLTPEQKEKAVFRFADDERFFWHYIPSDDIPKRYNRPRKGLPFREMTPPQKHLAHALLSAGLSQRGYIKATTIMSLEDVLRELEHDSGERRNPEKYFFSIFGEPSEKGIWGYRVEGHHVSLHLTVVDGKVVGSPTFFGANPAEVRQGPRQGLRVLSREEDLARELLASLDAKQKSAAIVSQKAYDDILTAADRKAALKGQPSGLSASQMNARQRELLQGLLEEYASNLPDDVAQARMEQIRKAGTNLQFAWAGVEQRGGPHYYRVQAPTFLVEYDNTQNGANHIHSVWRDFAGDWGEDLLAEHYNTSHK
jgi:hypothetical protein